MDNIDFIKTDDGTLGLYNSDIADIYHSTNGAHWESLTKFIEVGRLIDFAKSNNEIKILDICYGIGYNSKVSIDEIIKSGSKTKIIIDALEIDKNLVLMSPLLKNQKVNNKINKMILEVLIKNNMYNLSNIIEIMTDKTIIKHLNVKNVAFLVKTMLISTIKTSWLSEISAFLHKIYYNYITPRNKIEQKRPKNSQIDLKFHINDARTTVLELDSKYDCIFLDAFTPKKLPTLWTYEFLKELYKLLDENGMLITYSSSVAVRAAMIEAGFLVGKSLDENGKVLGTVATKNENLIRYKLNDYDLGLLDTTAGIFYKDETLDAPSEKIIATRAREVAESQRTTTSRYKHDYAKL